MAPYGINLQWDLELPVCDEAYTLEIVFTKPLPNQESSAFHSASIAGLQLAGECNNQSCTFMVHGASEPDFWNTWNSWENEWRRATQDMNRFNSRFTLRIDNEEQFFDDEHRQLLVESVWMSYGKHKMPLCWSQVDCKCKDVDAILKASLDPSYQFYLY